MKHTVIVGLGFGDESKGATVDYLCANNPVSAVVRFSGGPQTAHNVVLPTGTHHTFAQFGSGTLRSVPTLHTRFSLINPFNMAKEADHLKSLGIDDPFNLIAVDANCLLVTPYHRIANQMRETARGESRHGSCGQGVGETRAYQIKYTSDAPILRDLNPRHQDLLHQKLQLLKLRLVHEFGKLPADTPSVTELVRQYAALKYDTKMHIFETADVNDLIVDFGAINPLVFEGTQGVLLDESYGFHPHTTWTSTTFQNAELVLRECGFKRDEWTRLGLTRSYTTRHGAGPFPTEDVSLKSDFPEPHNGFGQFQGAWRVGYLDLTLLRYAVEACGGVDGVAVSHLDRLVGDFPVAEHSVKLEAHDCHVYRDIEWQESLTKTLLDKKNLNTRMHETNGVDELINWIYYATDAPIEIRAFGPTSEDRSNYGCTGLKI